MPLPRPIDLARRFQLRHKCTIENWAGRLAASLGPWAGARKTPPILEHGLDVKKNLDVGADDTTKLKELP
jgi:hypothetical protein